MGAALVSILRAHYLNSHFLHIQEHDEAGRPHEVVLQLAEEVTFLNRGAILKELNEIPDGSSVTLDTSGSVHIDHDVLEIIEDFETNAQSRNIRVRRIEQIPAALQAVPHLQRQLSEARS